MTAYVAGFLFNEGGSLVALIERTKDDWQKGKLNGIGGRIEPGETPEDAMTREFREEAGVEKIIPWRYFCRLTGGRFKPAPDALEQFGWTVHFFTARLPGSVPLLPIKNEEGLISLFAVSDLRRRKAIPNLHWLIPLALDLDAPFASVVETAAREQSK